MGTTVFVITAIQHVIVIYSNLPIGKTVASHNSCWASETAAEARYDKQWAELGHRGRSDFCVIDDDVVVAATDWPTRRATVITLSLLLFKNPFAFFLSNNAPHKRTPVYYMFFKRFRIFFLSYSFLLFLSAGSIHDFFFIYIYLLFVASSRANILANFG